MRLIGALIRTNRGKIIGLFLLAVVGIQIFGPRVKKPSGYTSV